VLRPTSWEPVTVNSRPRRSLLAQLAFALASLGISSIQIGVFAQSPFDRGAENLIVDFQSFATPLAAVVVVALGIAWLAGRISWGWPVAAIAGIALIFGAQDIVGWIQSLFGF
jgi:type IV secretory pathway VirB2 component (pilin)